MTTPVWLTGFEHGVATPTTNGGGLFNTVTGSPSIQSTTKNTGEYALRLNVNGSVTNVVRNIGSSDTFVARLYFRFNDLPSTSEYAEIFNLSTASGATLFFQVWLDGKYMFTWTNGPNVNVLGSVPSLNTWYRLDVKVYVGATTWTLDWKIDDVTQTAGSWTGQTSTTFNTGLKLGCDMTAAGDPWDLYLDDIVVSQTSGDYPIGAGGTEKLSPSSDGTHNAGTNCIEAQDGTDIGTTTAYNKINSVPPDSTTYIRQAPIGTGNYAEVLFSDITATHSAIIGAFGILAYTSATTTANTGGCIISKDSFSTSTTIWGVAGALSDYSDGSTSNLYYKSAKLANVTDDTTVNALKGRVGYADDATPDPYWIDLLVEVGYAISSGITQTVNQVTETDTAQAITKLKWKIVGQVSETDLAQAMTRRKGYAVAQVSETDTAQAVVKRKVWAVGQVAEADAAQVITRPQIAATVNQVTESDTAQAVTRRKLRTVAQAVETNIAQAILKIKKKVIGQVSESDTAQTIAGRKLKVAGQASETDLAQVISRRKSRVVTQVTETDLAQVITKLKRKIIGQVSETDLAQAVIRLAGNVIQQVEEMDAAFAVTGRKLKVVGQVSETDLSQAVTSRKLKVAGQASETDAAFAVAGRKLKVVGQVSETDLAQALFKRKVRIVEQTSEMDTALGIFVVQGIVVYGAMLVGRKGDPLRGWNVDQIIGTNDAPIRSDICHQLVGVKTRNL